MVLAELRTLTIALLRKRKTNNLTALIEFFQDSFEDLLKWLKNLQFL